MTTSRNMFKDQSHESYFFGYWYYDRHANRIYSYGNGGYRVCTGSVKFIGQNRHFGIIRHWMFEASRLRDKDLERLARYYKFLDEYADKVGVVINRHYHEDERYKDTPTAIDFAVNWNKSVPWYVSFYFIWLYRYPIMSFKRIRSWAHLVDLGMNEWQALKFANDGFFITNRSVKKISIPAFDYTLFDRNSRWRPLSEIYFNGKESNVCSIVSLAETRNEEVGFEFTNTPKTKKVNIFGCKHNVAISEPPNVKKAVAKIKDLIKLYELDKPVKIHFPEH